VKKALQISYFSSEKWMRIDHSLMDDNPIRTALVSRIVSGSGLRMAIDPTAHPTYGGGNISIPTACLSACLDGASRTPGGRSGFNTDPWSTPRARGKLRAVKQSIGATHIGHHPCGKNISADERGGLCVPHQDVKLILCDVSMTTRPRTVLKTRAFVCSPLTHWRPVRP